VCFTTLFIGFFKAVQVLDHVNGYVNVYVSARAKTAIVDVHVDAAVDGFGGIWLRSGLFEGPATIKPPALPDTYFLQPRLYSYRIFSSSTIRANPIGR
jgi:hypothetical protein